MELFFLIHSSYQLINIAHSVSVLKKSDHLELYRLSKGYKIWLHAR